jgi:hypothetical protein
MPDAMSGATAAAATARDRSSKPSYRRHALVVLDPFHDTLLARRHLSRPTGVHSFELGSGGAGASTDAGGGGIAGDFFCMCCRVDSYGNDTILTLARRHRRDRDRDGGQHAKQPHGARSSPTGSGGDDSVEFEFACTEAPFHVEYSEAVVGAPRSRLIRTLDTRDKRAWMLLTVFDPRTSRQENGGGGGGGGGANGASVIARLSAILSPAPPTPTLEFRQVARKQLGSLFFTKVGGGGVTTTESPAANRSLRPLLGDDGDYDYDDDDDEKTRVDDDNERNRGEPQGNLLEVRPFALRPHIKARERASTQIMRGVCGIALADTAEISRRVWTHAFSGGPIEVANIVTAYCSATPIPARAKQTWPSPSPPSPPLTYP